MRDPTRPAPRAAAILLLALAAAGVPATPAAAQDGAQDGAQDAAQLPAPRPVTLEEALALFAENSLELRVARADAAEAAGLARQAGAWPNPTVTGTHEPLSEGRRDYSESYLNLSQRVVWPGTRSARVDAAGERLLQARARLAADSARLAYRVKEAYAEALRAEGAETALAEVTDVFRAAARAAAERYDAEDISLYDLRRIRLERARYETRLAEASLEAARSRRALASLVAPGSDALELAPASPLEGRPPEVDAARAQERALRRRTDIEAAVAGARSAERSADAARRGRIPDLTATAGYKTQSDGLTGVYLGLSVPVPLWDRGAGEVAAAEARASAAGARATLVRRQVANDARRAAGAYGSVLRRAELLDGPDGPLAGEAADLLGIARVAYDEGEMELLELLDAARAHLDARLDRARLHAELWTRYFDLERAVGGFGGSDR